jgi:hypothetical protein
VRVEVLSDHPGDLLRAERQGAAPPGRRRPDAALARQA